MEMPSPYLYDDRDHLHALVQIGYDLGDDPEQARFSIASNIVTTLLVDAVFDDACDRYGITTDDVRLAENELADRVFPVADPQYRTTIQLGAVTVTQDDYEVDWRSMSWSPPQKRGGTA